MSNRFTADSHTSIKKTNKHGRGKKTQIRNKIDPCFQSVSTHPKTDPNTSHPDVFMFPCASFSTNPPEASGDFRDITDSLAWFGCWGG